MTGLRIMAVRVLVLATTWLLLAPSARACAVCFGAPGDKNTEAAGHAILFMLGVLVVVLAAVFATVIVLIWRANKRQSHDDGKI